jgi:hypothetical protein
MILWPVTVLRQPSVLAPQLFQFLALGGVGQLLAVAPLGRDRI